MTIRVQMLYIPTEQQMLCSEIGVYGISEQSSQTGYPAKKFCDSVVNAYLFQNQVTPFYMLYISF